MYDTFFTPFLLLSLNRGEHGGDGWAVGGIRDLEVLYSLFGSWFLAVHATRRLRKVHTLDAYLSPLDYMNLRGGCVPDLM